MQYVQTFFTANVYTLQVQVATKCIIYYIISNLLQSSKLNGDLRQWSASRGSWTICGSNLFAAEQMLNDIVVAVLHVQ